MKKEANKNVLMVVMEERERESMAIGVSKWSRDVFGRVSELILDFPLILVLKV